MVLAEKAKDLEITAYLIEALTRLNGFPGIRDGYRLARELLEKFWDGLYPAAADGDVESRISHILYLNGFEGPGTLIVPVRKIAMTAPTSIGAFSLAHHHQAMGLTRIADDKLRQKRIDEGVVTLETIQKAIAETPGKFYADLVEDIAQASAEIRKFCGTLRENSGFDLSSSDLLGVLDSYLDVVKDLARDKLHRAPAPDSAAGAAMHQGRDATNRVAPVIAAVIKNHGDAVRELRRLAKYYRETEPDSIIWFLLEQIANWEDIRTRTAIRTNPEGRPA